MDYLPSQGDRVDTTKKHDRYVVTCAQNDTRVNIPFLRSLENYCQLNKAALLVRPILYKNPTSRQEVSYTWDAEVLPYMLTSCIKLGTLNIDPRIAVQGACADPLAAIGAISKQSVVVPHPVVGLKAIASPGSSRPDYLISTGAATEATNYSLTLAGAKAEFHHTLAALLVEYDHKGQLFWVRHLYWDGEGIHDIDSYYTPDSASKRSVYAIVLGDIHLGREDTTVLDALLKGKRSLTGLLNPDTLVLHDVLDFSADSHHGQTLTANRSRSPFSSVQAELDNFVVWINNLAKQRPQRAIAIVDSNHHRHLDGWVDRFNNRRMVTSEIEVVLRCLTHTESGLSALQSYTHGLLARNVRWLDSKEPYLIAGVDVSQHGDRGANGARGSCKHFAKYKHKTVIGHSHEPAIVQGCKSVGASCKLPENYSQGYSSHDHACAVIYPNGHSTLVFVRNGRYRLGA